jgi:hypothetical protein
MRLAGVGENRAHDADEPPVKLDAAAKKRIANISIVHASPVALRVPLHHPRPAPDHEPVFALVGQAAQPHCPDDGQQRAERHPYQQAAGEYASPFELWVVVVAAVVW